MHSPNLSIKEYDFLSTINTEEIEIYLSRILLPNDKNSRSVVLTAGGAVMYIVQRSKNLNFNVDSYSTVESFINYSKFSSEVSEIIRESCSHCWQTLVDVPSYLNENEILAYILFGGRDSHKESSKNAILNLSAQYSVTNNIKNSIDIGGSSTDFSLRTMLINRFCEFVQLESEKEQYYLTLIRSEILGVDLCLKNDDVLSAEILPKYDFAFSYHPYLKNSDESFRKFRSAVLKKTELDFSDFENLSSSWLYCLTLLTVINNRGKAMAIMPSSSLVSVRDRKIRAYLMSEGMIESVVLLPERIIEPTSKNLCIVILSVGNDRVRFADASELYTESRKQNFLSEKNISEILKCMLSDLDNTCYKDVSDLLKDETVNLNPIKYTMSDEANKNTEQHSNYNVRTVKLSDITKSIRRGTAVNSKILDKSVSKEPTDIAYLLVSNIEDGTINNTEIQYLKDTRFIDEKSFVYDENIVMSKVGFPPKSAVVTVIDNGRKYVASGNLYIIEIDKEIANPYYVQAYFASENCRKALEKVISGAVIRTLPISVLKNLEIPLPSKMEQNKIAFQYVNGITKIEIMKDEINYLRSKLEQMF